MSWENDDFEVRGAPTAAVANVANTAKPKAKTLSLEARSFEKRKARAMEEMAELEAEAAAATAAVEKAKAGAKGTAASRAYIASLEKKAIAAAKAVAAKEMDIFEASAEEGKRIYLKKCRNRGVNQPNYERNVLGVIRDPETGKITGYRMCGQ